MKCTSLIVLLLVGIILPSMVLCSEQIPAYGLDPAPEMEEQSDEPMIPSGAFVQEEEMNENRPFDPQGENFVSEDQQQEFIAPDSDAHFRGEMMEPANPSSFIEADATVEAEADATTVTEADAATTTEAETSTGRRPCRNCSGRNRSRRYDIVPNYYPKILLQRQVFGGRNAAGEKRDRRFRCRGGGCARAKEGRRRKRSGPKNPRVKADKLAIALQSLKEEIMSRSQELRSETGWSKSVKKLMKNYRRKVHKVNNHVDELKLQAKNLLRRKRQIQNAMIQSTLNTKLRKAQADYSLLQKQLAHISNKESEFAATEKSLRQTMMQLRLHLRKLRGKHAPTFKHKKYH